MKVVALNGNPSKIGEAISCNGFSLPTDKMELQTANVYVMRSPQKS